MGGGGGDERFLKPINTIVFFGKATRQKGYFDFCDAMSSLFSDPSRRHIWSQITEIVLIGVSEPDNRLKSLPVTLRWGVFSREKARAEISRLQKTSLVVLPYKADNYPISVFEVIHAGAELLAYNSGGIPEILTSDGAASLLCAPGAKFLEAAICDRLLSSFWERCERIKKASFILHQVYDDRKRGYCAIFEKLKLAPERNIREIRGSVTVVIPNFNGKEAHLRDVCAGILNSFFKPAAIILVDDSSNEENFELLKRIGKTLSEELPVKVVRHAENLGLAGARNTGLSEVETPYVCVHDNDNVMSNHFLDHACRVLDENTEVGAVTVYTSMFFDGDPWEMAVSRSESYRPLGQDFGIGMYSNCFGDALAVYRTDVLRKLGGWDAGTKAKWEDWALFLRMAASQIPQWVIPRPLIFYRVRSDSMLRTFANFPAWNRIASSSGLPLSAAQSLLRVILHKSAVDSWHAPVSPERAQKILKSRRRAFWHLVQLIVRKGRRPGW